MQVAAFQQQFAETYRGVVGVGQERVLDDHARSPACFQDLDESLQEQKRGLSRANREVLLNLFAFLSAERWIEQVTEPYLAPNQHESLKHIFRGLWWSGLRLEESLNLWWDRLDRISIDLNSGRPLLRIPAEKEKGNRDRLYPVATEFAEMILAVPVSERCGPFFTVLTKDGNPYSRIRHQVGKIIAELGRKAGIVVKPHQKTGEKEFASAHDLRRSFGERWAKRVEAPFLQKMMRHSAITTTLRYYSSRDAVEAGAHIDEAFRRAEAGNVISLTK